jgi:hypothetical protein
LHFQLTLRGVQDPDSAHIGAQQLDRTCEDLVERLPQIALIPRRSSRP